MTEPPVRRRSMVYIDGFNLYYGAIRGGPNKWLNLQRYFEMIRPHDDLQGIRYFTALVDGSHQTAQETYLRALETLPLVEVILGQFKSTQVKCKVSGCTFTGSRMFVKPEEKRTDVNIAVRMVDDAYQDLTDQFIIVSGDSDLVPAVTTIKARFPEKKFVVYVPARDKTRGAAVELRSVADKDRHLPLEKLPLAQYPARVPDGSGGLISKPPSW